MNKQKSIFNITTNVFIIIILLALFTTLFTLLAPNKLEAKSIEPVYSQIPIETVATINANNSFFSEEASNNKLTEVRSSAVYTTTILTSLQDLVMTGYDNVAATIAYVHDYINDVLTSIQIESLSEIIDSRNTTS